jgi:DNA transposition AAA+ family ATPase
MFEVFAGALRRRKLRCIFGPSQIGKTTAAEEYARLHNHGETKFLRMPTRGSLGDFLEECAIRLSLGVQSKTRDLRRRVIDCFDERMLLIVDECHECLRSHYSDRSLATLDFIREIYDRRKCGVVLIGTDIFRLGLRSHKILRQLWLRGYRPLQLPPTPSAANLAEFAAHFGLAPAEDRNLSIEVAFTDDDGRERTERIQGNPIKLQTSVIEAYGLGRWLSILEDAAELAQDKGARITWGRVLAAHHETQRLEHGEASR